MRLAVFLCLAILHCSCASEPQKTDPSTIILEAFEDYRVVALGENHGHVELHDWILEFLRSADAQAAIDDIVVEWGNARYQDLIDRYMEGEDVSPDSLPLVWRNTIISPNTVWDAPIYERFFRHVRDINMETGHGNGYRVVLADTPVNWDDVESRDQLRPYFDRANHMAERVRQESLLKGRRSLFLAGGLHVSKLPRRRIRDDGVPIGEITPVAWLALRHPESVFVIQSMGRAAELDLYSLTTSGKPVGAVLAEDPALTRIPANQTTTLRNMDGTKPDVYGTHTLGEIVDAVILWNTTAVTLQEADPAVFQDDEYWASLNKRSHILRGRSMDDSLRLE